MVKKLDIKIIGPLILNCEIGQMKKVIKDDFHKLIIKIAESYHLKAAAVS